MTAIATNTTIPTEKSDPLAIRPATPELHARFMQWCEENSRLTAAHIAGLLDANKTQVSKYRSNKFQGDLARFESRLEDFLRADAERRSIDGQIFECDVTRNVATILNRVRSIGDVGVIYSPAGRGKTAACKLYAAQNALCTYLFVGAWNAHVGGLVGLLMESMDRGTWPGNVNRSKWLVERFANSKRLIIIDNAHRLNAHARAWLFDFHDETGCPIVLVGNPEILNAVGKLDQHQSRVGVKQEAKGSDASAVAAKLIAMHCPEIDGAASDLAIKVLKGPGHCRALVKQLLLTREIIAGSDLSPRDAFLAAHTQLIRDYSL